MQIDLLIENHLLIEGKNEAYVSELKRRLNSLRYNSLLKHGNSNKLYDKIRELFSAKGKPGYWQGVAELLVWFLCETAQKDYMPDYKTNEAKNCDLSFEIEDVRVNVEVKSPQIELSKNEDTAIADSKITLKPLVPYRTRLSKSETVAMYENFKKLLFSSAKVDFEIADIDLPKDNPLFEAISKASEQFPILDKSTFNLLFIPTTIDQMEKYWRYLTNPETGLLRLGCCLNESGNGWSISKQKISNISAVLLSNVMSLQHEYDVVSWDLAKSFNLLIMNGNNTKFTNCLQEQAICKFFPNDTQAFELKLEEYRNRLHNEKNGLDEDVVEMDKMIGFLKKHLTDRQVSKKS